MERRSAREIKDERKKKKVRKTGRKRKKEKKKEGKKKDTETIKSGKQKLAEKHKVKNKSIGYRNFEKCKKQIIK